MHSKITKTQKTYNIKLFILKFTISFPLMEIEVIPTNLQQKATKLKIKACLNNNVNIVFIPS